MYNIENFIGVFHNSVSNKECDAIVSHYEYVNSLNKTAKRQESDAVYSIYKDNSQYFFHRETDEELLNKNVELSNIFAAAVDQSYCLYADKYGILDTMSEHKLQNYDIKIQKNNPGEGYHMWHCETDGTNIDRLLLVILYLNDVKEGGETEFLYQSKRVNAKKGTMLICPGSFTHTHRGNPPLSGSKYIMNTWINFNK